MSLILSMLDTVPDVFVDGVLGEVEPRDVLNVEGVSHRLRDVVLSNLNRLKKSKKVAIEIQWADNTKGLTFYPDVSEPYSVLLKTNLYNIIDSNEEDKNNADNNESKIWTEEGVEFKQQPSLVEVRNTSSGDTNLLSFLLNKVYNVFARFTCLQFLSRMVVKHVEVRQLENNDFDLLSQMFKKYDIKLSRLDVNPFISRAFKDVEFVERRLSLECIQPLLTDSELTGITLRRLDPAIIVLRSFFELPFLKNVAVLQLEAPSEFDDDLLLSVLPSIRVLDIGECLVTPTGLNTLLKQYLAGVREFESIDLTFGPSTADDVDVLWPELVKGIPWTDHEMYYHPENDSDKGIGMEFLVANSSRSVKFFTNRSNYWYEELSDASLLDEDYENIFDDYLDDYDGDFDVDAEDFEGVDIDF